MVVGIFPDCSKLEGLIDALVSSSRDPKRLHVLSCEEVPTELASSGIQLVWIGDVMRTSSAGIITDAGGVGVPGLTNAGPSMIDSDELLDWLSDLNVPDGRTDDYARAVEEGRLVAGYPADSDAAATRQLFTTAGATIVEEF
jgi:hypothetical protein